MKSFWPKFANFWKRLQFSKIKTTQNQTIYTRHRHHSFQFTLADCPIPAYVGRPTQYRTSKLWIERQGWIIAAAITKYSPHKKQNRLGLYRLATAAASPPQTKNPHPTHIRMTITTCQHCMENNCNLHTLDLEIIVFGRHLLFNIIAISRHFNWQIMGSNLLLILDIMSMGRHSFENNGNRSMFDLKTIVISGT